MVHHVGPGGGLHGQGAGIWDLLMAPKHRGVLKRPCVSKRPISAILKKPSSAKASAIGDVSQSSAEASAIGDASRFRGTRVQLHGERVQCSADKVMELKEVLEREWKNGNGNLSAIEWKGVVQGVKKSQNWGAFSHGGARKGSEFRGIVKKPSIAKEPKNPSSAEASAIGDVSQSGGIGGGNVCIDNPQALSPASVQVHPPTTPPCLENSATESEKASQVRLENSAIGEALPELLPTASNGTKLLPYEILGRLGGGSYGDVYKARPKPKSRVRLPDQVPDVFVVKVMSKTLEKATKTTEQHRELAILKQMAHPNVIKLKGWRDTHFNVQLFFDLYDQDLRRYISKCPLSTNVANKLAKDLVSGLAYVHGCKILHRDVTTANVLIQTKSIPNQPLAVVAVLADFGCGRAMLPSSPGLKFPLTPDTTTIWYRAPEIFLTHDDYSYASDMWSYGVVLVEMSKGVPPFQRGSEYGMLISIFSALGTPSPMVWQSLVQAPEMKGVLGTCPFPQIQPPSTFPFGDTYGEEFVGLLKGLLQVSPESRSLSEQVLKHSWFVQ